MILVVSCKIVRWFYANFKAISETHIEDKYAMGRVCGFNAAGRHGLNQYWTHEPG